MATPRNPSRKNSRRLFADTSFWIGLTRHKDQYRQSALLWQQWIDRQAVRIVTTEAVLWEWLNAFSHPALRVGAANGYVTVHADPGVEVVPFQPAPIAKTIALYRSRLDKHWSLTDCLSFVVMNERRITDALTADQHFRQAGFRALLLEDPPA